MKLLSLVFINLMSISAFASSTVSEDRLDIQEKEIRELINKVEILEHNFHKFQKRLDEINPIATKDLYTETKEATADTLSSSNPDIFDISMLDELNQSSETDASIDKKQGVTSDKKLYDLALASFKDNKLEIAEEKFANFIKDYPQSSLISNAYFWYGEIFFKRKDFDQAAINYLKCYKQSNKGQKAPDALLKLSLSLAELKKNKEACGILERLESEFPSRAAVSITKARETRMKLGCSKFQN